MGRLTLSDPADELTRLSEDPRALDAKFWEYRALLEQSVEDAIRASQAVGVRVVSPPRRGWATLIFTRMCSIGRSLVRVLPDDEGLHPYDHWDFGAVATLSRNLLEAHLMHFYFGVEAVPEEEWLMRKWLVDLHDARSRRKLFGYMGHAGGPTDEEFGKLQARLQGHTLFAALPDRRQKHLLTGDHACFLSQDDILARMGGDRTAFRFLYHLFSAQTHTLPLAFHRMGGEDHSRGVENERDRGYMAFAVHVSAGVLLEATEHFKGLFPETFNALSAANLRR